MGTTGAIRATWYFVALVPAAIVAAVSSLVDHIEAMPRVVVPGTGEVELEPGDYVLYGETESTFGGTAYRIASLQLRCGMQALPDGAPIALSRPMARVSYGFGGYAGSSMFTLTIPHTGHYHLSCEGNGERTTDRKRTRLNSSH